MSEEAARRAANWRVWAIILLVGLIGLGVVGSFAAHNSSLPNVQIGLQTYSCGTASNPAPLSACRDAADTRNQQSALSLGSALLVGLLFFFGFRRHANTIERGASPTLDSPASPPPRTRFDARAVTEAAPSSTSAKPAGVTGTSVGRVGGSSEASDLHRYDVVERVGQLREDGVINDEAFATLKRFALEGHEVTGLDELDRVNELRKKGLLTHDEFSAVVDRVVESNILRLSTCKVVLTDFGPRPRSVQNRVIDLCIQERLDHPFRSSRELPVEIGSGLDYRTATKWLTEIEQRGGAADIEAE
jgi:hypothetical protein